MADPKYFNEIFQNSLKNKHESKPAKANKTTKQKLTELQVENLNRRLENLVPQFKKAIQARKLSDAKIVASDLQQVLRTLNKTTRLVEFKNQLFELALEEQEYVFAIEGFLSNRTCVSNKTRLHLEATALLAIAYLRKSEIEKA